MSSARYNQWLAKSTAHVAASVSGGKNIRRNCSSQQGRDSQSNKIAFHLNNSIG
jgi:hypothetical protein